MDDNWRSAGKKNDSKVDSCKSHNYAKSNHTHHRKAQADRHSSDEAGSGFVRNQKVVSRHSHTNRPRDNNFDGGPKLQSHRNQLDETDKESLELLGMEYDGIVKAVKLGRDGGLYCQFGLKGAPSFNNQGFVSRIFFNNKEKRNFQKGDKIQVQCIAKEPIVELCLTSEYVRPLLVLDINGPLGERTSYNPKDKLKKRTFTKRNHLQTFLSLVSNHYEIAIWSCSTRKNIELNLFAGINLVFVWSQEESTSLYPRTSFISSAKVSDVYII